MKTKKENSAFDHFGYALYGFGGLGLEIILMMIETSIWNTPGTDWSTSQHFIHWGLTCLIWGTIGVLLVKQLPEAKKGSGSIIAAVFLVILSVTYTSILWNGFKPAIELATNGSVKFIAQYVYYAFEGLLITLIIAHGQNALVKWFPKYQRIPFGGILLALTWGLIHILTQDAVTGLYTGIQSLLYGAIYLSLNKNFKCSYVVLTLIFML